MRRLLVATAVVGSALFAAVPVSAQAQPAASPPPAPPPFATTKVEGTDNVYIFRYQGHQSMFVVTPDGVGDRSDRPRPAPGRHHLHR